MHLPLTTAHAFPDRPHARCNTGASGVNWSDRRSQWGSLLVQVFQELMRLYVL